MSKLCLKDIDNILDEINSDIEKMNSKDIRKNVSRYNLNIKKIKACKEILEKAQTEIQESDEHQSSSEDLIGDNQFNDYLTDLEEVKKTLSNGVSIKISEAIDIYSKSLSKIKKCREYLENQKIEINNID